MRLIDIDKALEKDTLEELLPRAFFTSGADINETNSI